MHVLVGAVVHAPRYEADSPRRDSRPTAKIRGHVIYEPAQGVAPFVNPHGPAWWSMTKQPPTGDHHHAWIQALSAATRLRCQQRAVQENPLYCTIMLRLWLPVFTNQICDINSAPRHARHREVFIQEWFDNINLYYLILFTNMQFCENV